MHLSVQMCVHTRCSHSASSFRDFNLIFFFKMVHRQEPEFTVSFRLIGLQAQLIFFCFSPGVLGICYPTRPLYRVREPNSGCQDCAARALPNELPPRPTWTFIKQQQLSHLSLPQQALAFRLAFLTQDLQEEVQQRACLNP